MNELFIYAVKVNTSLVVFYLFYRLFFRRDTFWNLRRVYLLVGTFFSFIFPFISMQEWLSRQKSVITAIAAMPLNELVVGASDKNRPDFFTLDNVLTLLFTIGVLLFMLHTLVQFISILRQRIRGEKIQLLGVDIIRLLEKLNPFSFFKWIFINPALHSEHETSEILKHELTHVRQWHSMDVLLGHLMRILCWFNPAAWLLEYEIRLNLEFLADNAVIRSGVELKKYQYHLLSLTYEPADSKLANYFNVSLLKKRIKMMNTKNSKKSGLLKYALAVPLALALLLVSNMQDLMASAKNLMETKSISDGMTIHVSDEIAATDDVSVLSQLTVSSLTLQAEVNRDDIYNVVDVSPKFPGGDSELFKWLNQNIKYPIEAIQKSIQGQVTTQFIVGLNGKIENITILKSVDPLLDEEAKRVVSMMPNWTPGEHKGKIVKVRYTLPIIFKLD